MRTAETLVVVGWITLMALVAATPILVGYEWGRAHRPHTRASLHARHGSHRASRVSWPARLVDATLTGWRDLAAAHYLVTGGQPW